MSNRTLAIIWISLASAIGIFLSGFNLRTLSHLNKTGVQTEAIINELTPRNHNSFLYTYRVDNDRFSGIGSISSAAQQVGDKVRITYCADAPEISHSDDIKKSLKNESISVAMAAIMMPSFIILTLLLGRHTDRNASKELNLSLNNRYKVIHSSKGANEDFCAGKGQSQTYKVGKLAAIRLAINWLALILIFISALSTSLAYLLGKIAADQLPPWPFAGIATVLLVVQARYVLWMPWQVILTDHSLILANPLIKQDILYSSIIGLGIKTIGREKCVEVFRRDNKSVYFAAGMQNEENLLNFLTFYMRANRASDLGIESNTD